MNKKSLVPLKSLFLLLLITVVVSAQSGRAQSPFYQAVTNLNPVAYWPLQETIQPPVADVETNYGSLGSIANACYSSTNVLRSQTGVTGDGDTCVKFWNANGNFLGVPAADHRVSLTNAGAFSVEAWVQPTNTTTGSTAWTVMAQTGTALNGGANAAGWGLVQNYIPSTTNYNFWGWTFHVFNGAGTTGGAEAVAPYRYVANTWYHLVGVFDGTNAFLYVNGVLASEPTATGQFSPDTWDPLTIGATWQNTRGYAGWIDEVAIYTNALTAGQIQNHYNNVGGGSYASIITNSDNAYMYWRMDAPPVSTPPTASSFPVANNYGSAAGANGLYLGGTTPGVPGPSLPGLGSPSYACQFSPIGTDATNTTTIYKNGNGIAAVNVVLNSGVMLTNLPASLNLSNQPETLICWFKTGPSYSTFHNLIGLHGDDGPRLAIASGELEWFSGAGNNLASPTANYNDGNWHFLAGVYTNGGTFATGTNFLYVDGQLINTAVNISAQPPVLTNFDAILGGAINYSDSGNGNGNGSYADRFFDGSLAQVAFFTNALTQAQILNLYTNATAGVLPAVPVITGQPITGRTNSPGTGNNGSGPGSYVYMGVNFYGATTAQWYFNSSSNYAGATQLANGNKYAAASASVPGASSQQMTISNLVDSDSGYYYVVLANNSGSVTSILASLQVINEPFITSQSPAGGTFQLFTNQTSTFSVTAGGTNLIYQWYTNGVADTSLGTGPTYTLQSAGTGNAVSGMTYYCIVSNGTGSTATSATVTLTVLPLPASLTQSAYATSVLALNPSCYWPMHENEPAVAGDIETNYGSLGALGNGFYCDWTALGTGLITHGLAGALAGNTNPCVAFAGQTAAALIVPHTSALATIATPFTLEAWIRPFNDNSYSVIMGQGGGAGLLGSANLGGFALQYSGTPDTFSLVSWDGVAGADYEQKTTASYPPNQWYHLVCTFDGTNVVYYLNGNQAGFGTLQSAWPGPMIPDSWSPLVIGGGRWTSSGSTHPFTGLIDHVAIYTNLLSGSDIYQHYNDGANNSVTAYEADVATDNPLLYYRMNSPTYVQPPQSAWPVLTNYGSSSVNGVYRPGVIPGGAPGPSSGGIASAALSGNSSMPGNGMDAFADAGPAAALNADPVNYQSYSYALWFKGNPTDNRSWNSIMSANDSTWRCAVESNGKFYGFGDNAAITTAGSYDDGNWHHIVVTVQGVSTNASAINSTSNTLYIDGNLIGSAINATNNAGSASGSPAPEVMIGDESGYTNNAAPIGRGFGGDICEAAFFSGTVLSSNQVRALYNSAGMAPFIVQQPVSGTNIQGGAFTNSVVVSGGTPLYYQWYTNGVAFGGQTNSTVVVNPLGLNDAGTYWVVVSNSITSITSAPAALVVYASPVVLTQTPVTYTNLLLFLGGANPSFSLTASGASPLHYQWYSNGVAVLGATNASVTLTNVQVGMLTNYCIVSNFVGSVTGTVWNASVIPVTAPYPQAVMALNPYGYWRLDEPDDTLYDGNPGAIAEDYVNGHDGIYTNTYLGRPGYTANNIVNTDPTETSAQFDYFAAANCDANSIQGVDFYTGNGTNAEFSVAAWVNGTGANGNAGIVAKGYFYGEELDLDCGGPGDAYRFEVRNFAGTAYNADSTVLPTDSTWHLLVGVCDEANSNVLLYIDGQLAGSAAIPALSGITNSTSVPMYIGARCSSATSGANNQFIGSIDDVSIFKYALTAAQVANIYSAAGVPPFFTEVPPTNVIASAGTTLTVSAADNGTAPLTNQWWDATTGSPLTGQTNATLVISNISSTLNGHSIYLAVANTYGSTNSANVAVTIATSPSIIVDVPAQIFVPEGGSVSISVTAAGDMPLAYQWQVSGTNVVSWVNLSNGGRVSGALTNALTITDAQLSDAAYYQVVITNASGATTSSTAQLIVGGQQVTFDGDGVGWTGEQTGGYTTAEITNGMLTLTDGAGNEDRGFFFNYPQAISAFVASFTYQEAPGSTPTPADGTSFVLQNDPRAAAALGAGGGDLGVGGSTPITPSFELELNLYNSATGGSGYSVNTNGVIGPNLQMAGLLLTNGDPINITISYASGRPLALKFVDAVASTSFSTNINIGNLTNLVGGTTAYIGFTGGDGSDDSIQTISNFSFTPLPSLSVARAGNNVVVTFTGTLMSATNVAGPFNPVTGASSPYTTPATNSQLFFRTGQ